MRFLGQVHWHNRVLRYLAYFASPVHGVAHCTSFRRTITKQEAFTLKILLSHAPIVQPPHWDEPFHVFVDASNIAISSVLMQLFESRWFRPIFYISQRLSSAERNYSTTEHEAVGLIFSVTKFRHYLLERRFTFHVDHAMFYIAAKSSLIGKMARWAVLQKFEFDVIHRPGMQHAIVDYLSWLESGEGGGGGPR